MLEEQQRMIQNGQSDLEVVIVQHCKLVNGLPNIIGFEYSLDMSAQF